MFASSRAELLQLLAAIKAEPEENTPKLALADWLQEQPAEADRARGEFLHRFVQNNLLARTDPARQDFGALIRLWNAHEAEWAGALKRAGFVVWATNHLFRWGLLFPALDGTEQALARADAVAGTEEYAWVAGIAFRAVDEKHSPKLADSPLLDSLVALRLAPAEGRDRLLRRLCVSPRAAALHELDLGGGLVALGAVTGSSHLTGLRRLYLRQAEIARDEFQALSDSSGLAALRTLDLSGTPLGSDLVRALAEGTGLPALAELNLGPVSDRSCYIGDHGLRALLAGPRTGRLRRLGLGSNDLTVDGVVGLRHATQVRELAALDLSGNRLRDAGAAELADVAHLQSLEELNLSACGISNDGANALAQSPHLGRLNRLDLTHNRFGKRAEKALRARFGPALVTN